MKSTIAVINFYRAVNLIASGEGLWKQLSIQIISFQSALVFDLCRGTRVMLKH